LTRQRLKYGVVRLVIPTQRAHLEEIILGGVKFRAWDLGGHEQVRDLWREYYFETNAIVFLVDSGDEERLEEAKKELDGLLAEESLLGVPFLILGNKSDLQNALTEEQLISRLGLEKFINSEERRLKFSRCSLIDGTGYNDAFQWLCDEL